jgi:hypothetical protein
LSLDLTPPSFAATAVCEKKKRKKPKERRFVYPPRVAMAEGNPHRVNNDGSVNLLFRRDVDTYVQNLDVMREGAEFV